MENHHRPSWKAMKLEGSHENLGLQAPFFGGYDQYHSTNCSESCMKHSSYPIPVNLPLNLSSMCTLMGRCEHSNTPWGQFLLFTVCACIDCIYVINVFAFIITVNTSTQSPCQGIPWISPEEVLCAYTWLQVSWYFLHSTWSTLKLEKLTKYHTSAAYLATRNV